MDALFDVGLISFDDAGRMLYLADFLEPRTIDTEGLDAATRDFIAGMTDRYAVRLFEQLYIPKPWAID